MPTQSPPDRPALSADAAPGAPAADVPSAEVPAADVPSADVPAADQAPAVAHACPNCGADAPHAYCPQCGQAQRDRLRASLRDLAGEGIEELLDVDAKIWVTLRRLVARPGLLTLEYFAGRRARYVRPLRLYLSASVLFFVTYAVTRSDVVTSSVFGVQVYEAGSTAAAPVPADAGGLTVGGDATDSGIERTIEDRFARFDRLSPDEQRRTVIEGVQRHMPKAFFLLVPFSALLLHALHPRRGFTYAEHLILVLHVHAFGFLVATLGALTPAAAHDVEEVVVFLWLSTYLFLAMRRVYRRSRTATFVTLATLMLVYTLAVSGTLVAALLLVLLV